MALQGPCRRAVLEAASGESFADLRYFRRRPTAIAGNAVDVSRTGYTGDLGYELWIPAERAVDVWDALTMAGEPYGIRPAGMIALDVVRLEAGLILLEVDYTSARHAMNAEQAYSPYEIGLGRLVDPARPSSSANAPWRRTRWRRTEPAARRARADLGRHRRAVRRAGSATDGPGRGPGNTFRSTRGGGRQIGRVTSLGWSPILKKPIALASVPASHESAGSRLSVEWTVEGRRGRVGATVVELPFLDLPRKRA